MKMWGGGSVVEFFYRQAVQVAPDNLTILFE